jgi:hypothetical protein
VSKREDPDAPKPDAGEEREPLQKPIEKIKADNEKALKSEFEKLVIKEHKLEKFEHKEHKLEKFEIKEHKLEKFEHKEFKIESKELKPEKEKIEIKEHKPELEKPPAGEGFLPPEVSSPVERDQLLRHAESLEESARQIRHFIEKEERPDLSRGGLQNEGDE